MEIDDLIAPIIQLLNMKGYRTKACCSGHPFKGLYEEFVENINDLEASEYLLIEETDNGVRGVQEYIDGGLYILFEESFPDCLKETTPEGFEWDDDFIHNNTFIGWEQSCIRYRFKNRDFFSFLEEQLDVIKRLYEWVDKDL